MYSISSFLVHIETKHVPTYNEAILAGSLATNCKLGVGAATKFPSMFPSVFLITVHHRVKFEFSSHCCLLLAVFAVLVGTLKHSVRFEFPTDIANYGASTRMSGCFQINLQLLEDRTGFME